MEAVVDDTAPRFLVDWTPASERAYSAHFRFDPNSLAMLEGRSHAIFLAIGGSSEPVARIELRFRTGAYWIRGIVRTNGSGWITGAWAPISDGPHHIDLEWTSATSGFDGSFLVRIDGAQVTGMPTVENAGYRIDLIRLGAVAGIDSGTLGSMYFDDFELHRGVVDGPP